MTVEFVVVLLQLIALLSLLVLLHNTLLEDSRAPLLLAVTEGDLLSSLALLIFFVSSVFLLSLHFFFSFLFPSSLLFASLHDGHDPVSRARRAYS
mgnify:CR=1 FL=1